MLRSNSASGFSWLFSMSIPQNDKQSAVTSPAWRLFVCLVYGSLKSPRAGAFRSRCALHGKRESQHHVSGCNAARIQLHSRPRSARVLPKVSRLRELLTKSRPRRKKSSSQDATISRFRVIRAHARARGRNYSPIPQGPRFSFWARPSLFRPPFFKYYARRGASMIAPSLPIASTGQPSIASWQSASSSGVSGCL